jgi:dihydrofolate reductase
MRQLIAAEYLSLDGGMEDPGPTGDFEQRGWTMPYWSDELGKYQAELLFASDALLLGRVTYEEFAAAWPSRSGDPFTDYINRMPKFVASRTLQEPLTWNARLLKGDVAEEVRRLKAQTGKSIVIYGSRELVNTLVQHNLIDVYRLMVYPVALRTGKRFFGDGGDKITLKLTSATTTSTGVAVLTYQRGQET